MNYWIFQTPVFKTNTFWEMLRFRLSSHFPNVHFSFVQNSQIPHNSQIVRFTDSTISKSSICKASKFQSSKVSKLRSSKFEFSKLQSFNISNLCMFKFQIPNLQNEGSAHFTFLRCEISQRIISLNLLGICSCLFEILLHKMREPKSSN